MTKILSQAPAGGLRLVIMLLGTYPWLTKSMGEYVLRNLPNHISWLMEEVGRASENDAWEQLINIMAAKPTHHFQKFLETLLLTAGPAVRIKVLKQLALIGTPEALRVFEKRFFDNNVTERMQAYHLISFAKNIYALKLLKTHLESPSFQNAANDEKEAGYASMAQIGGENAYPWFESLWLQPGSGLFKKKNESERRLVLVRALAKTHPGMIAKLIEKTPVNTLAPELREAIQKIQLKWTGPQPKDGQA